MNSLAPGHEAFFKGNRNTPKPDFIDSHNVIDAKANSSGMDLSTYRDGQSLSKCEPGYFKGKPARWMSSTTARWRTGSIQAWVPYAPWPKKQFL